MKKFLTFVLVLAMVLTVPGFAMATTTFDVNNQTELDNALNTASAGDEIVIAAGTYSGPINPTNAGVTLTGVGDVTFTGETKITASNITIDNIDFANPSGIAVKGSFSGTFRNCKIEGNDALRWCYIVSGEKVTFENCEILGTVYGIHFDGGSGTLEIKDCTLQGFNAIGASVTPLTISDSKFKHSGSYGFLNMYQDATISNCTFEPSVKIGLEGIHTASFTGCKTSDDSDFTKLLYKSDVANPDKRFMLDGALVVSNQETLDSALADTDITSIILSEDIALNKKVSRTGGEVIIDLNGRNITGSVSDGYGMIYVGTSGKLTVKATNGGSITNNGGIAIGNYGTVTIEGGIITGDYALYNFCYNESTYGKATINGGELNGNGTEGISVANCGELTINDGTINDTLDSTAKLTITGGNVENLELDTPDYNPPETNTVITGGTFSGTVNSGNNGGGDAQAAFMYGGIYNGEPDHAYIAEGYAAYPIGKGWYEVAPAQGGTTPKPESKPSSGSGIDVEYEGGNSFSTSKSAVPTSVEIDGVEVPFTGDGKFFTVGCIDPSAEWVTVRWNSTSVTVNFKPDVNVVCAEVAIPKTGDMPIFAAVAAFFGF